MNVVKELNDKGHAGKMRYYLTKASVCVWRVCVACVRGVCG